MKFMLNINDAENDSLELSIHYKNADSTGYQFIRSELLPASLSDQSVTVYFDTITMGDEAQLKFILSDGENIVSDSTDYFSEINHQKTSFYLWPKSIYLAVNDTAKFFNAAYNFDTATYIFSFYPIDRSVSWTSENTDIASVTDGIVTGVAPGEVYIYLNVIAVDGNFKDSCLVTVYDPTSVVTKPETIDFKLYPNPTNGLLTIQINSYGAHSIQISTLNGQILYSSKMEGPTCQIDLSSFQKGLYFITVRSRDYMRTQKIIKF